MMLSIASRAQSCRLSLRLPSGRVHPQMGTLRGAVLVANGKVTQKQRMERAKLARRESEFGTPIVDWLLETSAYSQFLSQEAINDLRAREWSIKHIDSMAEKIRRLRIAFANKNRKPWNAGKKHKPETIAKIKSSVNKFVNDPAAIAERKRKLEERLLTHPEQVEEARRKATNALRERYGVQLHQKLGFKKRIIGRSGHSTPTYSLAVFHIHRGCSANVMFYYRPWRRDTMWTTKKKKPKAPRERRAQVEMSEEERRIRDEATRKRKSEAQRRLWQDPQYRERQVNRMRHATRKNSIQPKQIAKKLQETLGKLREAQELVPKLERVVVQLQQEVRAVADPDAQAAVQAALDNTQTSLDGAHRAVANLQSQVSTLRAELSDAEAKVADDDNDAQQNASTSKPGAQDPGLDYHDAVQPSSEPQGDDARGLSVPGAVGGKVDGEPSPTAMLDTAHGSSMSDNGTEMRSDAALASTAQSSGHDSGLHSSGSANVVFGLTSQHDADIASSSVLFQGRNSARGAQAKVRNGVGPPQVAGEASAGSDCVAEAATSSNGNGNGPHVGAGMNGHASMNGNGGENGGGNGLYMEPSSNGNGNGNGAAVLHANGVAYDGAGQFLSGKGAQTALNGSGVAVNDSTVNDTPSSEGLQTESFETGTDGHVVPDSSASKLQSKGGEGAGNVPGADGRCDGEAGEAASADEGSASETDENWLNKRTHRLPWQQ